MRAGNLFGSFEFSDAASKVEIDALAAWYADADYWSKVLRQEASKGQFA